MDNSEFDFSVLCQGVQEYFIVYLLQGTKDVQSMFWSNPSCPQMQAHMLGWGLAIFYFSKLIN